MKTYEWFFDALHALLPRIEDELQTMLTERECGLTESKAHHEAYLSGRKIAIDDHITIHVQASEFIRAMPPPDHHTPEDFQKLIHEMVIGNLQHWHYEPVVFLGDFAREVFVARSG